MYQEDEKKRQREREKRDLETRYTLPEIPAIMVHPSAIAKSGKFDCTQQSLSVLLDYRVEDNKEHSFEVRFVFWLSYLAYTGEPCYNKDHVNMQITLVYQGKNKEILDGLACSCS